MNPEDLTQEQEVLTENEKRISAIINLRKLIHYNILQIEGVELPTRALALMKTNAEQSRFWLGRLMGIFGDENPYKTASDVTVKIIEPMADQWDEPIALLDSSDVASIKRIYNDYGDHSNYALDLLGLFSHGEVGWIAAFNLYTSLSYVRMWTGMRLKEIHDANNFTAEVPKETSGILDLLNLTTDKDEEKQDD